MSVRFPYSKDQIMGRSKEGLCVGLNLPNIAKPEKDRSGNEVAVDLPPYKPAKVYVVDEYELATKMWGESEPGVLNYFVPVQAGNGLWLDFNSLYNLPHYYAACVSMQGINALTRLPAETPALEQYKINCPKHGKAFKHERYCSKCRYQWNAQNYLASAATPEGYLWLDGFRTVNGEVRQFYFSEDEARGVAAQVIKQKRSYSIGIALFQSRHPKPVQQPRPSPRASSHYHDTFLGGVLNQSPFDGLVHETSDEVFNIWGGHGTLSKVRHRVDNLSESDGEAYKLSSEVRFRGSRKLSATPEAHLIGSSNVESLKSRKNLEIGAGSKIKQLVYEDSNPIDFYQDEPSLIIHLNYCTVDVWEAITKGPKVDFTADGEGALAGLLVGVE